MYVKKPETKKPVVRIRRNRLSEEHTRLSMERINELLDHCGGRQELTYIVNKRLAKKKIPERMHAQEITSCIYKQKIIPQLAIRIEKAFDGMEGYEKYTKEYFCPDLREVQFIMIMESMNFDNE
jgi:hypothetical protein